MAEKYPKTPMATLDLSRVETYSIFSRESKVSIEELGKPSDGDSTLSAFLDDLPDILASRDLKEVASLIALARSSGRGVLLGMGAHPVKVGLGPLLADAIRTGIITGVATNGAAIIHDYELALSGMTSEDVGAVLGSGSFGMAEETAVALNRAIVDGNNKGEGIGLAIGRLIEEQDLPHRSQSLFAAAYRNNIPATVHVAMGTDIIHMHPSCDGAATGSASLRDFYLMAQQVAALDGGVFINLGSSVILPEVFLKTYSLARNLGHQIADITTVNMDFIQHYRPRVNVVQRPTSHSGKGFALTGHHEILLPLLLSAVKELMR
jgi:deoxyhypusine synthase